jgi:hypothetical protein
MVLAACTIAGCFLDRSGVSVSARVDSGFPIDAGMLDAGPPDAGPPDAGPPDTGPPSCNSQYGTAGGYLLCAERATECEFNAQLNGGTCGTLCTAFGGRCIDGYSDIDCMRNGAPIGCDQMHQDDICICSRGP